MASARSSSREPAFDGNGPSNSFLAVDLSSGSDNGSDVVSLSDFLTAPAIPDQNPADGPVVESPPVDHDPPPVDGSAHDLGLVPVVGQVLELPDLGSPFLDPPSQLSVQVPTLTPEQRAQYATVPKVSFSHRPASESPNGSENTDSEQTDLDEPDANLSNSPSSRSSPVPVRRSRRPAVMLKSNVQTSELDGRAARSSARSNRHMSRPAPAARRSLRLKGSTDKDPYPVDPLAVFLDEASLADESSSDSTVNVAVAPSDRPTGPLAQMRSLSFVPFQTAGPLINKNGPVDHFPPHASVCFGCYERVAPYARRAASDPTLRQAGSIPESQGLGVGCLLCCAVLHLGCTSNLTSSRRVGPASDSVSDGSGPLSLSTIVAKTNSWPKMRGWAVGRLSDLDLTTEPDGLVLVCRWCLKDTKCGPCVGNRALQQSDVGFGRLFRCSECWRTWHPAHLPPFDHDKYDFDRLEKDLPDCLRLGWCENESSGGGEPDAGSSSNRMDAYSRTWRCNDCESAPGKVVRILAWRTADESDIPPLTMFDEQAATGPIACTVELLVQFDEYSLRHVRWAPADWVGATARKTVQAFAQAGSAECRSIKEAIPWEAVAIDQILDLRLKDDRPTDTISSEDIGAVSKALVSFRSLGIESATWEVGLDHLASVDPAGQAAWEEAFDDYVRFTTAKRPRKWTSMPTFQTYRQRPFVPLAEQPVEIGNIKDSTKPRRELMTHQMDGLNWLLHHFYNRTNALLADEMGLGKTIQIAALVAHLSTVAGVGPWLIVVPGPTVANWRRELTKWAPMITIGTFSGIRKARELSYDHLLMDSNGDLRVNAVVASYDAVADHDWIRWFPHNRVRWQALVVDEAQRLKSGTGPLHDTLVRLAIPFRVLLTGTPIQNRPAELFNIIRFLCPGSDPAAELGVDAIAAHRTDATALTTSQIARLHRILKLLLLRRTKVSALGKELPPVSSVVVPVPMGGMQRMIYRAVLAGQASLLGTVLKKKGQRKSAKQPNVQLANVLMQLRKCLCHPWVFAPWTDEEAVVDERTHTTTAGKNQTLEIDGVDIPDDRSTTLQSSPKLALLARMLPVLIRDGHRVLVFSQFLHMLTLVSRLLTEIGLPSCRIDGRMSATEKQREMDAFNSADSQIPVFLLSTRAGGVGLNLASADTVVILDPDFNPHQDLQAIGRAHRIGQTRPVLALHMITRDSAEEKIWAIGRNKIRMERTLVGAVRSTEDSPDDSLTAETDEADPEMMERDLVSVLQHGAAKLFEGPSGEPPSPTVLRSVEKWDDGEIDKMLDRSQVTHDLDTKEDDTFGTAKIWEEGQVEDEGMLAVPQDSVGLVGVSSDAISSRQASEPADQADDPAFWDNLFAEHQKLREASMAELGRGKRKRVARLSLNEVEPADGSPTAGRKSDSSFAVSDGHLTDDSDQTVDFSMYPINLHGSVELLNDGVDGSTVVGGGAVPFSTISPHMPPEATAGVPLRLPLGLGVFHGPVPPGPFGRLSQTIAGLRTSQADVCRLCSTSHLGAPGVCPVLTNEAFQQFATDYLANFGSALAPNSVPAKAVEEALKVIRKSKDADQ